MNKVALAIASFLCGVAVTAGASLLVWLEVHPSTTEVWTTASEVSLDGGIVIPSGIDLVHHRWMPEGFATLKLYVNVEGDALENFNKCTQAKRNLVIPHWVVK